MRVLIGVSVSEQVKILTDKMCIFIVSTILENKMRVYIVGKKKSRKLANSMCVYTGNNQQCMLTLCVYTVKKEQTLPTICVCIVNNQQCLLTICVVI